MLVGFPGAWWRWRSERCVMSMQFEEIEAVCPRCSKVSAQRFYGPCVTCRDELRAKFLGEARDVEVPEYVPKMNVTPNAVALKDN